MRSFRSTAALAVCAMLLTSCFEEVVRETLFIEFAEDTSVVVTATTQVLAREVEPGTPLGARIARLRDDLAAERDFWSNRFAIVVPQDEEYRRERSGGRLSKVTRVATIDREQLARLMSGFAAISFVSAPGWDEIQLSAAKSDRATSQEKRVVAKKLEEWSYAYSKHVAVISELLRYVRDHPDRARIVVSRVLGSEWNDLDLTDEEKPLVKAVRESSENVLAPLSQPFDTAYTFEEMTRRVYDPFPADLAVRTPGPILECEGFSCGDEGVARVRKLSLLATIPRLESWASPDPLAFTQDVFGGTAGANELEARVEAFFAKPIMIAAVPPGAADVRAAVEEVLTPPTTYRLRWHVEPKEDEGGVRRRN